ncbi:MAG: hypothetical protein PSX37_00060, partial [bacterium]|nr:hypothetical protein [bacterium]
IGRYFESAYEAGVKAGEFESRHQALTLRATLASANKLTDWFDESGPTTREEIARWHAAMILRVVMCPRASAGRIDKIVDRAARATFGL